MGKLLECTSFAGKDGVPINVGRLLWGVHPGQMRANRHGTSIGCQQ